MLSSKLLIPNILTFLIQLALKVIPIVLLPSRLLQTKMNDIEKERHMDTKIVTIEESAVRQDSKLVEKKSEDVVSEEDHKNL